jgi:ribosome biogenesis protein SSF1/2
MAPNTFSKLRESKRNSVEDFVQVAGTLGATHLIRVSNNEKNVGHIHLSRMPAGPCFDLKINKLSLVSDLRSQVLSGGIAMSRDDEQYPPVAILNGFKSTDDKFAQLLSEAIKGLVPPIDITNINVRTCRRVILFNFDGQSQTLSIRHFRIGLTKKSVATLPTGQSCGVILNVRKSSRIPNLGKLVSIADLVTPKRESIEDGKEEAQIEIVTSKSNKKSSLVLTEIGPRIDASLSRVMSGVEEGTVLFSKFSPATVGSTIAKKKVKRVIRDPATKPAKRVRMEDTQDEEDFDMSD